MNDGTSGLPSAGGGDANRRLRHAILQGFVLIAAMALLGFGVSVLSDYFTEAQVAAAYRRAPQCAGPSATATSACYSVVNATVARVYSWTSRYGSSYRVELSLPTGSQRVWLAAGPAPQRGAPVGVKVWRGQPTLISTAGRLIETTDNPLWLEGDTLLRALLILAVGAGMLLVFAWHWGAVPALGPGPFPIDTIGTIAGYDDARGDPSRLVLRPVRRSDAPEGNPFGSITATNVMLRILPLGLFFVGGFVGDPPVRHQRLTWAAPIVGILVATFAAVVVWRELYLRLGSLFADAEGFGATNWLGLARRYPRDQLQRIVISYVDSGRAGTGVVVLFVANSGSVLFRVRGRWWRREELQRFASFLGVQVENLWDPAVPIPPTSPVTAAQLRAQFRGAESYWRAHPTITAWVLTPVILVAVSLLILALQGR